MNKVRKQCAHDQHLFLPKLYDFVRSYNASQHSTTLTSPYFRMFGRDPTTTIPKLKGNKSGEGLVKRRRKEAEKHEHQVKARNKKSYDRRLNVGAQSIPEGEDVWLYQPRARKYEHSFHPTPARIMDQRGDQLTVNHEGRTLLRHRSFVKPCSSKDVADPYVTKSGRISRPPDRYH